MGVALLSACSGDDIAGTDAGVSGGESVAVTLTVGRPSDDTRTTLEGNGNGGLNSLWSAGDQLLVVNPDGTEAGFLTLKSGEGTSEGVFSGTLESLAAGDNDCRIWYLGAGVDGKSPYAYAAKGTGNKVSVKVGFKDNDESAAGTLSGKEIDLPRADLLSGKVAISVRSGNGYARESVTLGQHLALAHFTVTLPENVECKVGDILSVNTEGGNLPNAGTLDAYAAGAISGDAGEAAYGYSVTLAQASSVAEVYLPFLPGNYKLTFTLSTGGKQYAYTFDNTKTVEAGVYYNGASDGSGIAVSMTDQSVDDTVGPVFTINGKKWRFTSGNLYYNKNTDTWGIHEKQTYFTNAGGLDLAGETKSSPELIGLFSWGATGLEDAQMPTTLKESASQTAYGGSYFPTTASSSKNSTIKNLWENEFVYDWGKAYMKKGRAENDERQYITPSQQVISSLMNSAFVQGATVKGAGPNGEDVKGLLVIPGQYSLQGAKDFIRSVEGADCLSSMVSVNHNNTGNTLSYKNITLDNYDVLKKLNDAIFFPAASKRNFTSGKVYDSNGKGFYWTSKASTTNAYDLYFNGETGGFCYNGSSANSSMSRDQKMAVRLLVEVDE